MTKDNQFKPNISKTYEVSYMEQKQSKLSLIARKSKVVDKSGSNYLSSRVEEVNPGYGPVLKEGGIPMNDGSSSKSSEYSICANSNCSRIIRRSLVYCSEHSQDSKKFASSIKNANEVAGSFYKTAKKSGGIVIETELKPGEITVNYFSKKE